MIFTRTLHFKLKYAILFTGDVIYATYSVKENSFFSLRKN